MIENDEILRPFKTGELLKFIDQTKLHLPKTLRPHHYLLMHYRLNSIFAQQRKDSSGPMAASTISSRFKCKFYTHKMGDIINCTFLAISDDSDNNNHNGYEEDYTIFAYSMEPDNRELRECFHHTKLIKWNKNPLIINIQEKNSKIVWEIIKNQNYTIQWQTPDYCIWLPKDKAKSLDIVIPDNVEVKPLSIHDTDLINAEWPHGSPATYPYVRTQIEINGGIGVYERQTNALLAWVLLTDNFTPGSLQTLKSAQRNGYAELALRTLCRQIAETENIDIISFVMVDNMPSRKLFHKLGFIEYDTCYWIKICCC